MTPSLDSLFLQAHWAPKQHLQEALQEPLVALMGVQLVGQQREAMGLQEPLLLLLEGSAEVCIQQLGTSAQFKAMRRDSFHRLIKWRLLYRHVSMW